MLRSCSTIKTISIVWYTWISSLAPVTGRKMQSEGIEKNSWELKNHLNAAYLHINRCTTTPFVHFEWNSRELKQIGLHENIAIHLKPGRIRTVSSVNHRAGGGKVFIVRFIPSRALGHDATNTHLIDNRYNQKRFVLLFAIYRAEMCMRSGNVRKTSPSGANCCFSSSVVRFCECWQYAGMYHIVVLS